MTAFPATFIQIHYHCRHGGVKQVMDRYAQNCKACSSGATRTVLVCSGPTEVTTSGDHDEVVDVPSLDYKEFTSPREFDEAKSTIQSALADVIMSDKIVLPAAVLFHNQSLGKNVAASVAFAELARQYGSDQIRFFPVLHDFAEEGRTAMVNQLRTVSEWKRSVYDDLYCVGAPVTFVVPGMQAYQILNKLKFPVRLLPNPVRTGKADIDCDVLRDQLALYAGAEHSGFDISKLIWYYPSRIIGRKNILEALFLSIVMETSLILGPEGTSPVDAYLISMLNELVRRYQLRAIINPVKNALKTGAFADPVSAMYAVCDYAVSTSVAEGFGFGLYESVFYERPLLGRYPHGFAYPCEVLIDNLYRLVPVPVEFVDENELIVKYYEKFGHSDTIEKKIIALKSAEIVDFADLDIVMQNNLIERFLNDSVCRREWLKILEIGFPGWPGSGKLYSNARRVLDRNRLTLSEYFSPENDTSRFCDTFSAIPDRCSESFESSRLDVMFQPERMTLLL